MAEEELEAETQTDIIKRFLAGYIKKGRDNLAMLLLTGLPTLLINQGINWFAEQTTSQPWQILWYLLPIAVVANILWRKFRGAQKPMQQRSLWLFFSAYVLLFSLAAGANFLDFRRDLVGYGDVTPRNWLALNQLGDWRYSIAKRLPLLPRDLRVVLIDPEENESLLTRRMNLMRLIKLAKIQGARGVGLDYYFKQTTPIDTTLCQVMKESGFPIVLGYSFKHIGNEPVPIPSALDCLPETVTQGHLLGYQEADDRVRAIPLYFLGQKDRPALSLQIARVLSGYDAEKEAELPELFYPLSPDETIPQVSLRELVKDAAARESLRDRFILIGERSDTDRFETPFGEVAGVLMHAYAVESLRHGHYVQRQSDWSSFLMVFAVCFLLASLAVEGVSVKKLLLSTSVISLGVIALAAITMAIWQVWIAVSYPLLALWGLLALLVSWRASKQ